jgi:2-haloacid dehalogenase
MTPDVLTFDCYGTLIDWEAGILAALRPYAPSMPDEEILAKYAEFEPNAEAGPFVPYREVLRRVTRSFSKLLGRTLPDDCLAEALPSWPPFADTVPALRELSRRFRLGVISNVDDDLFAQTARRLQVSFEWIITAQQVGSYKPSLQNFREALARIGLPPGRLVHVAQSRYHDIAPARSLGIPTVWVNRRGRPGGATPSSTAPPDLQVPNLAALVSLLAN